jgi:hypothetical protein
LYVIVPDPVPIPPGGDVKIVGVVSIHIVCVPVMEPAVVAADTETVTVVE